MGYPTWKKVNKNRWESEEGQRSGDGQWVPDFVVSREKSWYSTWYGKMRTSAKLDAFESAKGARDHYTRAMNKPAKSLEEKLAELDSIADSLTSPWPRGEMAREALDNTLAAEQEWDDA